MVKHLHIGWIQNPEIQQDRKWNYDEGFYFGIQTSANINTNPRTEQGSITVDKGLFEFYKDYFDGIRSFEK